MWIVNVVGALKFYTWARYSFSLVTYIVLNANVAAPSLMLSTLDNILAEDILKYFFLFFPGKRIWLFMQIVFLENKNISNLSTAEFA